jgi:hypothetical protein
MQEQGTTAPEPTRAPWSLVDLELETSAGEIRRAIATLRAAGDHLHHAAAGLPETPLTESQGTLYNELLHGVATALAALDAALHHGAAEAVESG